MSKSTLHIGFTNKYYTLWRISSEIQYATNPRGEHYASHNKTTYQYIQNLSMTLEEAQVKAKSMGCTNSEPNNDLCGRNSSWEFSTKLYCEVPKVSPYFEFGKFANTLIADCDEISYILWYYKETGNYQTKLRLQQSDEFVEHENEFIGVEEYEIIKRRLEERQVADKEIADIEASDYGHIILTFESNLSQGGYYSNYRNIILFPEYKMMYYGGFGYALPMIDGVGKKLKGKELVLLVRVVYSGVYERKILEVVKIKSIDGIQVNYKQHATTSNY